MWKSCALAASLVVAGFAGAPAAVAQNMNLPTSGQANVVYSVTPQDVANVLASRGLVTQIMTSGPNPVVRAFASQGDLDANNMRFFVRMTACNLPNNPPGCLGLQFAVARPLNGPEDSARARRVADAFHAQEAFGRVYIIENQFMLMDFYVITDRGVTREHLEACALEYDFRSRRLQEVWDRTP